MIRTKMLWRLMPLLAVMSLFLAGCGNDNLSALKPKGPVAAEQLRLMEISLGVMVFVLAVVFSIYIYVLIRFRKKKGDKDIIPKQVEGNHVLEIIWTIVPIILLVIIAVPTVMYTFKHSEDYRQDKNAIHVKVTGHQFWWEFQYGDYQINTAQDLVIPVGKKISFEHVAADVKHSFWVPSIGGKIDTNPGVTNTNWLQADVPGTYFGKCAELCGASHALMDFKVRAVSQDEFDAWVADMKKQAATVSADTAEGQKLFTSKSCISCHATDASGVGSGPNLHGFADRERIAGVLERGALNDMHLKEWIRDPQSVKDGAKMPKIAMTDDELNSIVKYLDSLKINQ